MLKKSGPGAVIAVLILFGAGYTTRHRALVVVRDGHVLGYSKSSDLFKHADYVARVLRHAIKSPRDREQWASLSPILEGDSERRALEHDMIRNAKSQELSSGFEGDHRSPHNVMRRAVAWIC